MVFVWMMTEVSAFCQYSDLVVIVRVTLQDVAQSATIAKAVNKINFFIVVVGFRVSLSLFSR